jgi:multiple sugar transport system ATP-binding protein
MAELEFRDLRKAFPGGTLAVEDLNLLVADGEFLVLVGPSGSGKTTVLRMAAGLERATSGDVLIGGENVNDVAPPDRDIAMVFQTYALYPHMTVYENMAFGLKLHGIGKAEIRSRVESAAKMLELDDLLKRKPSQLSGGQRQRVAMGRAIVREPRAFLMDEPLSNLDAKLRVGMRASLAELHGRLGVTTIYVTHDQTEAMTLGQRVAVMRDGRIVQVDRPQELYNKPRDLFVAAFIGSPSMNLVEATVESGAVRFGGLTIPLDPARRPPRDGRVVLGARPEAFEDAVFADPALPRIEVRVDVLEQLGADTHAFFRIDARRPEVDLGTTDDDAALLAEQTTLFTARVDPRSAARQGVDARLAVDPGAFHFFDAETGAALLGRDTDTDAAEIEQVPVGSTESWS